VKLQRHGLLAALAAGALALTACGGEDAGSSSAGGEKLSGTIKVDGSSTVAPLSEAAAELFREQNSGVQVTVGTSGTGGGFKKFCNGETDISDASRPIKDEEKTACAAKNIGYRELLVANDALTLVVNKENTWADCLTTAQLKKIWDRGSKLDTWSEVDPKFPNEPLKLFGPGTDSGTFDFFTGEINGEEGRSRSDYNATEDDNVTVTGVAGTKGGLGYFGFSYYEENQDKLKALKVDGGGGCVPPSAEGAQNGTYKPLSRPLFIYPAASALKRKEVVAFCEFYLQNAQDIAKQAQFIALNPTQQETSKAELEELKKQAGG
jgi:phosphate transport system substrate-binding protein